MRTIVGSHGKSVFNLDIATHKWKDTAHSQIGIINIIKMSILLPIPTKITTAFVTENNK